MFCNKCGAPLDDNATFCSNCGAPVAAVPGEVPAAKPKNTMATVSMVFGIISIPLISLAAATVAIILACVSKKKGKSTFASVGLVTGIIGAVVSVVSIALAIPAFLEMLEGLGNLPY